jgi:hypothetical protein
MTDRLQGIKTKEDGIYAVVTAIWNIPIKEVV